MQTDRAASAESALLKLGAPVVCGVWANTLRSRGETNESDAPESGLRALSEQRQVVCVGRSKRRPKRRLGREGAPLGQRGGAPLFVNLAGDEMALLIEMVVDLGMN